ncbi:hypothetical protein D6C92_10438 [Aureobasidium pullulans]|nr:hypothetical protein D6C92_10438 [Aureobasidium pullulans]
MSHLSFEQQRSITLVPANIQEHILRAVPNVQRNMIEAIQTQQAALMQRMSHLPRAAQTYLSNNVIHYQHYVLRQPPADQLPELWRRVNIERDSQVAAGDVTRPWTQPRPPGS